MVRRRIKKVDYYYGEVIKILGHKDDVGIDILSKVYEHDIEPNFLEETMEEILYARTGYRSFKQVKEEWS